MKVSARGGTRLHKHDDPRRGAAMGISSQTGNSSSDRGSGHRMTTSRARAGNESGRRASARRPVEAGSALVYFMPSLAQFASAFFTNEAGSASNACFASAFENR